MQTVERLVMEVNNDDRIETMLPKYLETNTNEKVEKEEEEMLTT